jgi:hypothetical protein
MAHRVCCPTSRLVFVTRSTSVRHLVLLRHGRRDEFEGVCAHEGTGDAFALDLRHVAVHALTSGATVLVVSMLLHRRYVGAVRRRSAVTIEADLVCGLSKLRIVVGAVYVVAGGTGNSVTVHHALHEVIPLHPVLMRCSVREMSEGCLP